jgi:hypothetical protein
MAIFLYNAQLYEAILQKSSVAKETILVSTTSIGSGAHQVFSQEIIKNPPKDIRFLFRLSDSAVKRGKINPYEIQYIIEHIKGINIKSNEYFNSNIYIFDNSAIMTSASLTKEAFECNTEAGVLFEGLEAEQAKAFFNDYLWGSAKAIGDLKKYKQMWNLRQKTTKKSNIKIVKPHTKIEDWTKATNVNTWFIGVAKRISPKFERQIKKETNWQTNLSIVGDIGYHAFTQIKLGDYTYIADLSKRGKIVIDFGRIFDKARVETDEGDLHMAFEREKTYVLQREQFFEMLKNANIRSKTSEIPLNNDQLNQIALVLSSIKRKRKRKSPKKVP